MLQNQIIRRCGTQYAPIIVDDPAEIFQLHTNLSKLMQPHISMLSFCFIQAKLSKCLNIGRFTFTELYNKTGVPKTHLHPVLERLSSHGFVRIVNRGVDKEAWREIEMSPFVFRTIEQLEIFNFP